ncbi:unnamed protein product [Polarella glacialis]|uniref:Phosphoglycerate mutase n=1 Tax=Polarella glacialis TaxID=89957 RepID=A0A813HVR4_POLGL|nr:unnamed protein product [Polarella glacialis]CAE8693381.1 unnamed protein product [Polarella glacialis]
MRVLLIRHAESFNNALAARPGMTRERWEAERQVDPDLSDLGRREAEALGSFLANLSNKSNDKNNDNKNNDKNNDNDHNNSNNNNSSNNNIGDASGCAAAVVPLVALAVSPVKRALQTLQPAADRLGMRPEVWTDCFEVGGMYHASGTAHRGLTRAEMQAQFPGFQLPEEVSETGWYSLAGHESPEKARARADAVAAKLRLLAGRPEASRGTLALLSHHDFMNLLLQSLLQQEEAFSHSNTGMTCVDVGPGLGDAKLVFFNCTDHLLGPGAAKM